MIDLRLLRQFVVVAEELHFHRAAQRLHMSQPPLTAAIQRLEAQVGAALIARGNRTLGLTAAGQVLLEQARQTLEQAANALQLTRDVAAGRQGRLRISYVGSALYGRLPAVIRAFRLAHPGVHLDLREATSAQQQRLLREGTIDLAVVIPPVPDAGDLAMQAFDEDGLSIALPLHHPPIRGLAELAAAPFVLWPAGEGSGFHAHVLSICAAAGFQPQVVQEAHGMHGVLSLVAVEAGVSLVPSSMAGFRPEEVRYQPLLQPEARFNLHACYRPQQDHPARDAWLALAAAMA